MSPEPGTHPDADHHLGGVEVPGRLPSSTADENRPATPLDIATERTNPATADIDLLSTEDILRLLNREDCVVPEAVGHALPALAHAVDLAVESLRSGGRVHYVGAGTSGRLAVLDAAELIPTYNVPPDWFLAHQAGGDQAFRQPIENAEDDVTAGSTAIDTHASGTDFVFGLTASGRTPYVLGALAAAQRLGAGTALMSANPVSGNPADVVIVVDTGPEPIAGSTRMKAGTAQKLVLTSFSTAVMVRMGRTYSNLMVSMVATNAKLRARTVRILREATGRSDDICTRALEVAGGDLKTALVHLLADVDVDRAATALTASGGHVREALRSVLA